MRQQLLYLGIASLVLLLVLAAITFSSLSNLERALLVGVVLVLAALVWRIATNPKLREDHTVASPIAAESPYLLDGLSHAVLKCDSDGTIRSANAEALRFFNYEDTVGRNILSVTLSHEIMQMIEYAIKSQHLQHKEIILTAALDRTVQVRVWPDLASESSVILSIEDVTNLRKLERVRQDFVANVSHELRTPLTSIRAMAELLEDEVTDPKSIQKRYLGKISSEVDRLTHIVNDLLTLTEAESKPLVMEIVDFDEIVRQTVDQYIPLAHQKGIQLECSIDSEVHVIGNSGQIRQIVVNLLSNSLSYTNSGEIRVILAKESEAILQIIDTGIGIAEADLGRIFERFYRVDKGRSRESGGTGLGLSIVKHLVELHNGTISVESMLNRGSAFEVKIPLATSVKGAEPPTA